MTTPAIFSVTFLSLALITFGAPNAHPLLGRKSLKIEVPLTDGASAPVSRDVQGRIVGGVEAPRDRFPFQAALVPYQSNGFCGGSLISARWILTAAFCVYQNNAVVVYLGIYDLNDPTEPFTTVVTNAIEVHPKFEYATINNNIALVDLGQPVTLSEFIQPVKLCLEEQSDLPGRVASVAGWGLVSDNSISISNKLRYVDLELIDSFTCRQYYGLIVVTNSTVCANGIDGVIATFCGGDMGGPLVLETASGGARNGEQGLLGVASFIASVSCERGYPSGYERVAAHAQWITDVTDVTN